MPVGAPLSLRRALPIIDAAGQLGIPVLVKGGSGIGKSKALTQLAQVRGEHLEVVNAHLYEPTDFGGIPVTSGGDVHLAPMPWVRRVVEADKPVRVFLDEYNLAPQPTVNSSMRLLLENVSGETQLPEGTKFVAAVNPVESSAGAWELSAPISGRFLHLDVVCDPDEWVTGMLTGWADTPDQVTCLDPDETEKAAAMTKVISFISAHPGLLNKEPSDPALAAQAWPSSRKWEWVARILPYIPHDDSLTIHTVQGLVGREAAAAFLTFVAEVDLPATDDVLADPAGTDWANEPAERVQGILTGVVGAAGRDVDTYEAAGRVLHAVLDADRADVAVPVFKAYLLNAPAGARRDNKLLAGFAPLLTRAGKVR